jgi:hypothetical protein
LFISLPTPSQRPRVYNKFLHHFINRLGHNRKITKKVPPEGAEVQEKKRKMIRNNGRILVPASRIRCTWCAHITRKNPEWKQRNPSDIVLRMKRRIQRHYNGFHHEEEFPQLNYYLKPGEEEEEDDEIERDPIPTKRPRASFPKKARIVRRKRVRVKKKEKERLLIVSNGSCRK